MIKLERLSPIDPDFRRADYRVVNTNILFTKINKSSWDVWLSIPDDNEDRWTIAVDSPTLGKACDQAQSFINTRLKP